MRLFISFVAIAVLAVALGVTSASAELVGITGSANTGPEAETRPASNVGPDTARLNGKVNPHQRPTVYRFDWGPTTDYGFRTSDTAAGKGESGVSAATTLRGLRQGTTYHFRIVATSDQGTNYGEDMTFTTTGVAPPEDSTPAPGGGTTTPGEGAPTPGDAPAAPGDTPAAPGDGTAAPGTGEPGTPGEPGDLGTDTGSGIAEGSGQAFDIGGEPQLGERIDVAPIAGRVTINPPGPAGYQVLEEGATVPIGSIIDTRKGTVAITTELPAGSTQTAEFWGERFKVGQRPDQRGLTDIMLRGEMPKCGSKGSAKGKIGTAKHKRKRRLWGRDTRGRWRTHGRGSQATTRGTSWVMQERCDGTYTRVTEGSIEVRDHYLKRTVVLNAGERYVARPESKHSRR